MDDHATIVVSTPASHIPGYDPAAHPHAFAGTHTIAVSYHMVKATHP